MALSSHEVDVFEESRPRLEAIAYRLLGSAADAEDAVQDTFLRWQAADRGYVDVPAAWLTRALTNVCLNQLGSARARRVDYVGRWLPEPLLAGDPMLGPADTVEQRESVSMAMLTLMERLSPNERVVYVLREAFGHTHAEIAGMLDVTEANCQQIFRRAKRHLAGGRVRKPVDPSAARTIAEEFIAAAVSGSTEPLLVLLSGDATSVGDGGGKVPARVTPVVGAAAVARFLHHLFRPSPAKRAMVDTGPAVHAGVANGEPALVVTVGAELLGIAVLTVTVDGIDSVLLQVNPDKLGRAARHWTASGRPEPSRILW